MSVASKHHSEAVFVACVDRLLVAYRATGLHNSLYSRFGCDLHTVGEGEEGVGSEHRAVKVEAKALSLCNSLAQRVNARGLPYAGSIKLFVLCEDDSV